MNFQVGEIVKSWKNGLFENLPRVQKGVKMAKVVVFLVNFKKSKRSSKSMDGSRRYLSALKRSFTT